MTLPVRRRICISILQYPVAVLYISEYFIPSENCFEATYFEVQVFNLYIFLRTIVLCPCPKVLGMNYNFFLVKGPINESILMYVTHTSTINYVVSRYVYEISDYNLHGVRRPTTIRPPPPPPSGSNNKKRSPPKSGEPNGRQHMQAGSSQIRV